MTISNLNSAAFATSLLMVMAMYMHDARLDLVTETDTKQHKTSEVTSEGNIAEDFAQLSAGRHIHVEKTTLISNSTNYGASLASSTPRNRDNEDKIAVNKLITNTYGNNSK